MIGKRAQIADPSPTIKGKTNKLSQRDEWQQRDQSLSPSSSPTVTIWPFFTVIAN
jgi:hypothetical protein